ADCTDRDASACDEATNTCVGCRGDADCDDAAWPLCRDGICVACKTDTDCGNGNACDGVETGDSGGQCQSGTPLSCQGSNACETRSCDPVSGCSAPKSVPNGTVCSDQNACTEGDTCQSGVCVGAAVDC